MLFGVQLEIMENCNYLPLHTLSLIKSLVKRGEQDALMQLTDPFEWTRINDNLNMKILSDFEIM